MGNFKYFTKFPVYRGVNNIYLIVTAGQLSRLERRANNANVVGSSHILAKLLLHLHKYSIYGLCSGNIMGNIKYFTKFPVYRVNKIYLIVTAGQLSRLERRANNANVVGSTPILGKLLLNYFMDRNIMGDF